MALIACLKLKLRYIVMTLCRVVLRSIVDLHSKSTMKYVTWHDIVTYMWNDTLQVTVVPRLRIAAKLVTGVSILMLIGHCAQACAWCMTYVGWTPNENISIGLSLVLLYAVALASITLCACVIRGEFDPTYLTVVLTSGVAMGAVIGPFVPLTFRTPSTAAIHAFNGVAVVMLMWVVATAVYCVAQIARLLRREFAEYVRGIRSELARKRKW